jgi:hypothetical protein
MALQNVKDDFAECIGLRDGRRPDATAGGLQLYSSAGISEAVRFYFNFI